MRRPDATSAAHSTFPPQPPRLSTLAPPLGHDTLTPFFSLLQSRALLTFQQLSLIVPSALGGKESGLLGSGGRSWPGLRRLKNEAGGGFD